MDGRELAVSAARAGGRWSLLIAAPPPSGSATVPEAVRPSRSFDVAVEEQAPGEYLAHVSGAASNGASGAGSNVASPAASSATVPVHVPHLRGDRGHAAGRPGTAAAGSLQILSPMPGRVVKVLVKPGDAVDARQALVVVEAMKMENELRAPRAGVVGDVRASEGALVEARAVLVVLD